MSRGHDWQNDVCLRRCNVDGDIFWHGVKTLMWMWLCRACCNTDVPALRQSIDKENDETSGWAATRAGKTSYLLHSALVAEAVYKDAYSFDFVRLLQQKRSMKTTTWSGETRWMESRTFLWSSVKVWPLCFSCLKMNPRQVVEYEMPWLFNLLVIVLIYVCFVKTLITFVNISAGKAKMDKRNIKLWHIVNSSDSGTVFFWESWTAGMFSKNTEHYQSLSRKAGEGEGETSLLSKPHILLSQMVCFSVHLMLNVDWMEFKRTHYLKPKWLIWRKQASASSFHYDLWLLWAATSGLAFPLPVDNISTVVEWSSL